MVHCGLTQIITCHLKGIFPLLLPNFFFYDASYFPSTLEQTQIVWIWFNLLAPNSVSLKPWKERRGELG